MNFADALGHVIDIVGRPDKKPSARRELNAAISLAVTEGDFVFDIIETSVALDDTLYSQTITYDLLPRFRKVAHMRLFGASKLLTPIAGSQVFEAGKQLRDVFYLVSDGVKVHTSTLDHTMLIGYYEYPPVLKDLILGQDTIGQEIPIYTSDTHWTLDRMPWAIIHKAAAGVFQEVGNPDESARLNSMFVAEYEAARRDFKHGVHYG